jgi:hypothetical protein
MSEREHSQHPRRDSNPRFRAENPASQPLDHGGMHKSEVLESNQALLGISEPCRHGHRPPKLRRQESNLRVAINSRAPSRSATPERSEAKAEGEGVEPSTAEAAPVFETGYRAGGSPSEVAPAGVEPAPCRSRVGSSALSYGAEQCGRQGSNLRRVAFQATALPS